jgi:hypothetical protein
MKFITFKKKEPKIAEIMSHFIGKSILREFVRKDGKFYGWRITGLAETSAETINYYYFLKKLNK